MGRVEINALIDDGIRVTATSAIPSCEIITVDDSLSQTTELDGDDEIVITGITPAVLNPSEPIDLTNATFITQPSAIPFQTGRRKIRPGRSDAVMDLSGESSANVSTPFETSATSINNSVVNLLDSDDDDLSHSVSIPRLAPLIKKRRREETTTPKQPPPPSAPPPAQTDITCPICMDDKNEILAANKSLMASPCGHMVCSECHAQSMQSMGSGRGKMMPCVTCRKRVKGTAFIKLFI